MQLLDPADRRTIAADLAANVLPGAKGFYPEIVNQSAPSYFGDAERADTDKLIALIDRLSPTRYTLGAYDIVRLIVAHETLAARGR